MAVYHDEETSRFVLLDDEGEYAGEVEYEREGNTLVLLRAEVPRERQGSGLGVRLVRETLELIRDENYGPILPICPFIVKFLVKNPEFQALRA